MKRRDFLLQSGLAGMALGLAPGGRLHAAPGPAYDGPLYVMVEANGAWDVSSFCDPKLNVPGEPEINHWARSGDIEQVGNIRYAPFADNRPFFERYYRDMLVINGVDAQTNAHTVGVINNWSGRLSVGYPSMPAQLAATMAPELPMAWLNNGGYSTSADLARFTRLDDPFAVKSLIYSNEERWGDGTYLDPDDWARVRAAQQNRLAALRNGSRLLPWQVKHRGAYHDARAQAEDLKRFADLIPDDSDALEPNTFEGEWAPIRRQAQLALIAFQAGVAMSADILHWDFDTHDNHDNRHDRALRVLTGGIDYLWQTAEELGLADRLTVMVASDFSRTPYYNDDNGKDHWPIGSVMFMQKNAPWGNRVVGHTDEGQNASAINPATLEVDEAAGRIIYPSSIITAFRKLAGIHDHPLIQPFAFFDSPDFDFFNPSLSTPQGGDPRNSLR